MATSGSYLMCLCSKACSWNLSWHYVNSMSWSVIDGEGVMGKERWLGPSIMHGMSILNYMGHWHGGRGRVHFNIYSRIIHFAKPKPHNTTFGIHMLQ